MRTSLRVIHLHSRPTLGARDAAGMPRLVAELLAIAFAMVLAAAAVSSAITSA
jgi:hypothetical protein